MKRTSKVVLLTIIMSCFLTMPVFAKGEKPIVALGADLSSEQRQTVLSLMGLSEEDLAQYEVITITNDMEHQYLDSYLDASVIGSRSLSCVKITPAESGHGVLVTTQNINYCTTGMYRNALLTAGVSDADILVVAPTSLSGTAALIGAIKGYEATSQENVVSEETLDVAMDELITTAQLASAKEAAEGVSNEDIEALIAFVKAKVAAGDLKDEKDVEAAIAEGEQKFGVNLSEEEEKQVVEIMKKIEGLGLDPNVLVQQAEDLYSKFGADFIKNMDKDAVKEEIAKQVSSGMFDSLIQSIKNFFRGLLAS